MSDTHTSPDEPTQYEIRIDGHLDDRWAERFEGMTLDREVNGITRLTGPVIDQAALHGLLRAVRDLGMPLLSVIHREPDQAEEQDTRPKTAPYRSTEEEQT